MTTTTKICPDYTLIDTCDFPEYSDYVEFCEGNGVEPCDENSEDYWQYVYDLQEIEWDDLMAQVPDVPVFVTGNLGLWNGRPGIVPQFFDNIHDAIEKCVSGVDYIKITMEDGHLVVYGSHHDGTNIFYIQKATGDGLVLKDECDENYEDLPDNLPENCVTVFEDYLY